MEKRIYFDPTVLTLAAAAGGGFVLFWLLRRQSAEKSSSEPCCVSTLTGTPPPVTETGSRSPSVAAKLANRDWRRPRQTATDARPTPRIQAARENSAWPLDAVKREAEAMRNSGRQWQDPQFPPSDESLFEDPSNPPLDWLRDGERGGVIQDATLQWKGPESFCVTKRPLGKRCDGTPTWLYSDADSDGVASCLDVDAGEICQGSLGDCYFLCALAACVRDMAIADDLIDEEFEDVGIYGVSFWVEGHWEMVWVDRSFPCYRPARAAHNGRWRLIFASCADPKEIWPLVIEKAYAKLHGSYEALTGGRIIEALCALTGGQGGALNLKSPLCSRERVITILRRTAELAAAGTRFVGAGSLQQLEETQAMGIVSAHAYTVLDMYEDQQNSQTLVKLRNPWNHGEWRGEWADGSPSWRTTAGRAAAKATGYASSDDGEFWMSIDDFLLRFQTLDVCDVSAECRAERLAALRAEFHAQHDDGNAGGDVGPDDRRDIDELLAEIEGKGASHKQRKKKPKKHK